jgi:hypothetical protein
MANCQSVTVDDDAMASTTISGPDPDSDPLVCHLAAEVIGSRSPAA